MPQDENVSPVVGEEGVSGGEVISELAAVEERPKRKLNKRVLVGIIVGVVVVLGGVFGWLWFANRFTVTEIAAWYDFDSFNEKSFRTSCRDAIWSSGGWDFFRGQEPSFLPIRGGDNTIVVRCGDRERVFETYISMENALIMTDEEIDWGLLDFAGDGIGNQVKRDLGLATYTDDTTGDGMKDNVLLALGLDPLMRHNANEEREWVTFADFEEDADVKLVATGPGNIANTFLDTVDVNPFGTSRFVASDIVTISTSSDQRATSLELTFFGRFTDDHAVFRLDPRTNELTEIGGERVSLMEGGAVLATNGGTRSGARIVAQAEAYDAFYFVGRRAQVPAERPTHQIGIVLDNTGSMYSCEEFTRILEEQGRRVPADICDMDINNDPEFLRIDMMQALVNQLGSEDILYSVAAFTFDYCRLLDWTDDVGAVNEAIDSIRETCQRFNGTHIQGPTRRMANSIDTTLWGSKYVIVLTDGHETCGGLLQWCQPLTDRELARFRENGIRIITVCLGDCNMEMLQRLSTQTGGTTLLAADAAGLSGLVDLITRGMESAFVTRDVKGDGNEKLLLADSGFRANVDGFSFRNFGSTTSPGGNCFGFSVLAREIFTGNFALSRGAGRAGSTELREYTVTSGNAARLQRGVVYSSARLSGIYDTLKVASELPRDYRVLVDGVPMINPRFRDDIVRAGWSPRVEDRDPPQALMIGSDELFSRGEFAGLLNTFDVEVAEEFYDDWQMLHLISRHHVKQHEMGFFEVFRRLGDLMRISSVNINALRQELAGGSPAILAMMSPTGGHAVLAKALYRDMSQAVYNITLYENNRPGSMDLVATVTRVVMPDGSGSVMVFKYEVGNTRYTTAREFSIDRGDWWGEVRSGEGSGQN